MRNLILMFVLITNVIFVQGQNNVIFSETFGDITKLEGENMLEEIVVKLNNKIDNVGKIDGDAMVVNNFSSSLRSNNIQECNISTNKSNTNIEGKSFILLNGIDNNNSIYVNKKFTINLGSETHDLLGINVNMCYSGKVSVLIEESNDNITWNNVCYLKESYDSGKIWKNINLESIFKKNTQYIRFSYVGSGDIKYGVGMDDIKIINNSNGTYNNMLGKEVSIDTGLEKESFSKNKTIIALNDNYLEIKSENEIKNVMVYDFSGREVRNIASTNIEVSDLTSGLYIVKVVDSYNNVTNKKFLKK